MEDVNVLLVHILIRLGIDANVQMVEYLETKPIVVIVVEYVPVRVHVVTIIVVICIVLLVIQIITTTVYLQEHAPNAVQDTLPVLVEQSVHHIQIHGSVIR